MAEDNRPKWKHEIKEDLARWLDSHSVTKITHHWEFTSEDTSRDWIELHAIEGDKKEVSRQVPTRFLSDDRWNAEVAFDPDHRTLVVLSDDVRKTIAAIDAFDKKHARELADFKRLKAKFEA